MSKQRVQLRMAAAALCAAGLIGGLATPERVVAEEIPGSEIIVEKSTIIDPTWGGVIGSYTYDATNDEYYVCVYGSSQGLRKIWRDSPGDPWQSDTYVGETFASYPSDMMRFARATDVPGGDTNADLRAFSMMAGMLLNPATVSRTVKAPANYPPTGGAYGPVDGQGNITISYAPGTLAYIVDGGYTKMGSSYSSPDDYDNTKNIFTWDLREIGDATTAQLDYNTGKSGATDGMGNLLPDQNPGGLFGAYNQTDWNDALQVVMNETAMRDAYTAYRAANPQHGMPELPDESVDNFGRQFAWSSDGSSLYAVDKGYDIGGIYKINASTGDTEMIHVEMSNDMYSEPSVVATSALDFGAGAGAGDQIVVNGTAYTGNPGGLSYVVDTGSSVSSARAILYGDRMQTQLGDVEAGTLSYTTSDSSGNLYFWESGSDGLFRRDPEGRITKVLSKAEAEEIAFEHDGKRSNGGGFLRLQTREDASGTHVTFRGDNSFIGVAHIHDPADLNKDGDVDQADRDAFIAQRRIAMLGTIPSAGDGTAYTDYLAADLNGDLAVDDDGVVERGSVDQMDTLLFFQHINQKPGDLNLDGTVSATEHAIVQNNIGVSGSWFQGDFNRDGVVTQADIDMMPTAGTTYDIADVEPTASYLGNATGTWADVQKPSTAQADADSLVKLGRDGGATITGDAGHTLVGHLTVGSTDATHTGTTTLALAADSQLDAALGVVVTGKGEFDATAAGAGVKLGIPGYGGTMVVEDGGQLTGDFTLQGSLRMKNSAAESLNVTIEDTDTASFLAKNGEGALTVNSTNTYTGETRIEGGSLIVGAAGAIPAASEVYVGPEASLNLNGHDVTIGGLDSDDSDFSVPQIALGANMLTYDSDKDGGFEGDISGTGSLVKKGTGELELDAVTSFTGGVTVEAGTLRIDEDNALVPASAVTIDEGGTLGLYRADQELAEILGEGTIANAYSGSSSSSSYNTTLTLNTADTSGDDAVDNSFAGRIADDSGSADVARMAVVKKGSGTLELTGVNTFERGLTIEAGTVQVSGNDSLGAAGGSVTIESGAELRAAGNILDRPITGAEGAVLAAVGPMLVGDAASTDGFDFGGRVDVGPHLVGLVDADAAQLHGATLDGGTLSSLNSIQMQPSDPTNIDTAITGHGTIEGAFTAGVDGVSDRAIVFGESANGGITMPGVVRGNGEWINVQHTGLFVPGFSPDHTLVGGSGSLSDAIVELFGTSPGTFDGSTATAGEYDQWFVYGDEVGTAYEGYLLDGTLQVRLEDGFAPNAGDQFSIFATGTRDPLFGVQFGEGQLRYGDGFDLDFSAASLADGLWWEYSATESGLSLAVVPEPSTIAVLAVGALAAVKRRRNR